MYGDPSDPSPEVRGLTAEMPSYTRDWQFDPYHQRLAFARQHDPGHSEADTEWGVWEVFQQDHRGDHHKHVGSLHAPDAEFALVLAKENFARRGDCVNLWVVPAHCIHATDYEDADVFVHTTDKLYREPAGFQGLRRKSQGRGGSPGASGAASESSGSPADPVDAEPDDDDSHVDSVLHSADDLAVRDLARAKREQA
jgi:ring-1,2-phenylacetyl-CoA epoxidase subunit PaaB